LPAKKGTRDSYPRDAAEEFEDLEGESEQRLQFGIPYRGM
jgi:hypothetical protein